MAGILPVPPVPLPPMVYPVERYQEIREFTNLYERDNNFFRKWIFSKEKECIVYLMGFKIYESILANPFDPIFQGLLSGEKVGEFCYFKGLFHTIQSYMIMEGYNEFTYQSTVGMASSVQTDENSRVDISRLYQKAHFEFIDSVILDDDDVNFTPLYPYLKTQDDLKDLIRLNNQLKKEITTF